MSGIFLYEVREDKKDGHRFAWITGYDGKVADLVVPEFIRIEQPGVAGGVLPVEAIGNHAFSGRQDIETVSLPKTIRTLYGFAFHNCRKLRKITLFDSIDDYYDGVCRQCDLLTEIEITMTRGWFEVIRNFLSDNDKTLRFRIHMPGDGEPSAAEDAGQHWDGDLSNADNAGKYRDGGRASDNLTGTDMRMDGDICESFEKEKGNADGDDSGKSATALLTFPEYVYDFAENTMARTIQFSIAGSGMFYRECVDRRKIDYRGYDKLFEKGRIDGGEIAEDIAIGRLLFPVELDDGYRCQYEEYLHEHGASVLRRRVTGWDAGFACGEILKKLLAYRCGSAMSLFSADAIDDAIRLSSDMGLTEVTAILMEYSSAHTSLAPQRFEF